MKRIYALFIALLLLLTSCSFKGDVAVVDSKEFVRTRMEQIIEAINAKDAKTIKEMFSANIIKESPKLEEDIQTMLNAFQGKIEDYDWDGCHTTNRRKSGLKKRVEYIAWSTMSAGNERYVLYIKDCAKDTFDNSTGLECLFVVKESDEYTKLSKAIKEEITGFYAPI